MWSRKLLFTALAIVLVCAAAGGGYLWYRSTQPRPSTPVSQPQPTSTQPSNPAQNQPSETAPSTPASYRVSVYFSKHPESDDDPSKVFAVARTSPNLGVGTFAITELLQGPSDQEKASGYFSTAQLRNEPSNCSGQDFILTIQNGTAILRFCRPFNHLGVVADGQADSEIKATLKQFSTVSKVVILNYKGNCEFDLSGLNLCMQQ